MNKYRVARFYDSRCSATSNNMKLVHWPTAVDGWAVTFGTARRGLDRAAVRPGPFLLYQM